ncbi:hypothetical protein F4819DRAFT_476452 [Hypoxylon fuscum]|nr:hypothetical protein F4819DRAFT_476452 [Hypoxylon fuscum]
MSRYFCQGVSLSLFWLSNLRGAPNETREDVKSHHDIIDAEKEGKSRTRPSHRTKKSNCAGGYISRCNLSAYY